MPTTGKELRVFDEGDLRGGRRGSFIDRETAFCGMIVNLAIAEV